MLTLEKLPKPILLQIIYLTSDIDKINLRLVSLSFKNLAECKFVWSGNINDLSKRVNFKGLIKYQLEKHLEKEDVQGEALLKKLQLRDGTLIIPLSEELTNSNRVNLRSKLIDKIRDYHCQFPAVLCGITVLAVLGSGLAVFIINGDDLYDWILNNCDPYHSSLSNCNEGVEKYLLKNSFFSIPGGFGLGSLLKTIDKAIEYFITAKSFQIKINGGDKSESLRSKLGWMAYNYRNGILLLAWSSIGYLVLQNPPSLSIDAKDCFNDNDTDYSDCVENVYNEKFNINNQFGAFVSTFAGYYFPIIAGGIYSLYKYIKNHYTSVSSSQTTQLSVQQPTFSNPKAYTHFFLSRNGTDVTADVKEEITPLLNHVRATH